MVGSPLWAAIIQVARLPIGGCERSTQLSRPVIRHGRLPAGCATLISASRFSTAISRSNSAAIQA